MHLDNYDNLVLEPVNVDDAYSIMLYPHPLLKKTASPVVEFGDALDYAVAKMFRTMYALKGLGLSAVQVGIPVDVFVLDLSEEQIAPCVFCNTHIEAGYGKSYEPEGCLSFPGVSENIQRHQTIRGHAFDVRGEKFDFEVSDLRAIAIQHEADHSKGITILDHMTGIRKRNTLKKLAKNARHNR